MQIFAFRDKSKLIGTLGILALLLVAFARFYPVIASYKASFADYADGRGTVSYVYAVKEQFDRKGLEVFKSDIFKWDRIGLPDEPPILSPITMFWKAMIVSLGSFLSATETYDTVALLAAWTITLAGFLLALEVGATVPFALMAGFMLANLDNFSMRVTGHLFGLGFYGASILYVWGVIRYVRKPTWPRAITMGLLYVLSFQVNEYNTYFGTWITLTLMPSTWFYYHSRAELARQWPRILAQMLVSGVMSILLCCLVFPNLIGAKLFPSLFSAVTSFDVSRPESDYGYWTIGSPLTILRPSQVFPDWLTSLSMFRPKTHEVSFRIGFVVVAMIWVAQAWLKRRAAPAWEAGRRAIIWWLPTVVIAILLGTSRHMPFSLVHITQKFAPIFRVGSRALLYLDIAVVMMFAFVGSRLFENLRDKSRWLQAGFAAFVAFAVFDVANFRVYGVDRLSELPPPGAYAALVGQPDQMILELPHQSGSRRFGVDYATYYFYNQFHEKPILNNRMGTAFELQQLGNLCQLDAPKLAELKRLGVGYVSANLGTDFGNFEYLASLPQLELLAQDPARKIYRLK